MPRVLPTNLGNKVDAQYGTQPAIVIDIYWNGTTPHSYSDRELFFDNDGNTRVPAKILSISGLETIITLDKGNSTSINLTLDDTDNSIKEIMKTINIHNKYVVVKHVYAELSSSADDTILLFRGQINGPIVYREGSRSISFNIVDKLEDREVGFSPEQGQFSFLSEESVGKAWPLAFGTVKRVPGVKVTGQITGESLTNYSIITYKEILELKERIATWQTFVEQKTQMDADIDDEDELNDPTDEDRIQLLNKLAESDLAVKQLLRQLQFYSPNNETVINNFRDKLIEIVNFERIIEKAQSDNLELYSEQYGYELRSPNTSEELNPDEATRPIIGLENSSENEFQFINSDSQLTPAERDTLRNERNAEINSNNDLITDNQALLTTAKEELLEIQNDLMDFSLSEIKVFGGEKFPQNTNVTILVNKKKLYGYFNQQTFTILDSNISSTNNLDFDARDNDDVDTFWLEQNVSVKGLYLFISKTDQPNRLIYIKEQVGNKCFFQPIVFNETSANTDRFEPVKFDDTYTIVKSSPYVPASWLDYGGNQAGKINLDEWQLITGLNENLEDSDWTIEIGDQITLANESKDTYIFNCVPTGYTPATNVYEVLGTRNGKLTPLPSKYYLGNMNYQLGQLNVLKIDVPIRLSEIEGEGWSDEIYCTFKSGLSNNPADIIAFLITGYSGLTYDFSSFTVVGALLTYFDANFVLFERRNVLQVINEIAWQARCALWKKENVIFIKSLAHSTADTYSWTSADIDYNSLSIETTTSEDLVTVFIANYRSDYTQEKDHKITLRNNIRSYGEHKREFDFYIYTDQELVRRVATFWLTRYSNIWNKLRFSTPIHTIRAETFDTIGVTLPNNLLGEDEVHGLVESVIYDANSLEIQYELWLPILSGHTQSYEWAYPGSQSALIPYPATIENEAGGYITGYNVTSGFNYEYGTRPNDLGTQFLSDLALISGIPDPEVNLVDYLILPERKIEKTPETVLDLKKTKIVDPKTGKFGFLNDIFSVNYGTAGRNAYDLYSGDYPPSEAPQNVVDLLPKQDSKLVVDLTKSLFSELFVQDVPINNESENLSFRKGYAKILGKMRCAFDRIHQTFAPVGNKTFLARLTGAYPTDVPYNENNTFRLDTLFAFEYAFEEVEMVLELLPESFSVNRSKLTYRKKPNGRELRVTNTAPKIYAYNIMELGNPIIGQEAAESWLTNGFKINVPGASESRQALTFKAIGGGGTMDAQPPDQLYGYDPTTIGKSSPIVWMTEYYIANTASKIRLPIYLFQATNSMDGLCVVSP